MLERVLSVAVAVVVVVWGAWLHEITHAGVARALGGTVHRVDLMDLVVEFELEDPRKRAAVIHSPLLIGIILSPLVYAVLTGGGSLLYRAAMLVSWFVYTARGGPGELGITSKGVYWPRLRV